MAVTISGAFGHLPAFGQCAEFAAFEQLCAFDELRWDCVEVDDIDHCLTLKKWRNDLCSNVTRGSQATAVANSNWSLTRGDLICSNDSADAARQVRFWRACVSKHSQRVCRTAENRALTCDNTSPSGTLLALARPRRAGRDRLRWSVTCREPATLVGKGFHAIVGVGNSSVSLANSAETRSIAGVRESVCAHMDSRV